MGCEALSLSCVQPTVPDTHMTKLLHDSQVPYISRIYNPSRRHINTFAHILAVT